MNLIPSPARNGPRKAFAAGALAVAVLLAGAVFAMKVTDSRPFCGSCHVMAEAAWTHKLSAHAKVACNECHAPADLAAKLPFKAAAGTHDIVVNTFGKPEDVIHAGLDTKAVVNANCKSCHTMTNVNTASLEAKQYCTDCHRNVRHMKAKPIAQREVADE